MFFPAVHGQTAHPRWRAAMRLAQEVRHKSEDIEDAVLLDAVQAIRRRVRIVDREYNIPISPATAETDHSLHRPACARLCTRPVPTWLALTTTIGTSRGRCQL